MFSGKIVFHSLSDRVYVGGWQHVATLCSDLASFTALVPWPTPKKVTEKPGVSHRGVFLHLQLRQLLLQMRDHPKRLQLQRATRKGGDFAGTTSGGKKQELINNLRNDEKHLGQTTWDPYPKDGGTIPKTDNLEGGARKLMWIHHAYIDQQREKRQNPTVLNQPHQQNRYQYISICIVLICFKHLEPIAT